MARDCLLDREHLPLDCEPDVMACGGLPGIYAVLVIAMVVVLFVCAMWLEDR